MGDRPPPAQAPSPLLRPLRIALGVLALAALVTLILTGLSNCHSAGHM